MMRGGIAYQLVPSAPLTGAIGSSSSLVDPWPTPSTFDSVEMKATETPVEWFRRHEACEARGVRKQYPLTLAAQTGMSEGQFKRLRPTATASDDGKLGPYAQGGTALSAAIRTWPTPTVSGNWNRKGASAESGDGLRTAVNLWATPAARDFRSGKASPETMDRNSRPLNEQVTAQTGGALNPAWVEQLQGFPDGWTDGPPVPVKNRTPGKRPAPQPAAPPDRTD
jgi:hypothetical protein